MKIEDLKLQPAVAQWLALKSVNETIGLNGLVPSLVVFGRLPRFPGQNGRPYQSERKTTGAVTLAEVGQAACESQINPALRSQISHLPKR